VVMAVSFLVQPLVFSRLLIVQAALLVIALIGLWRLALRFAQAQMRKRGIGVEKVLIVGAGSVGRSVLQTIVARPDLGFKVIGFVDAGPGRGPTDLGRVPAVGTVECLPHVIETQPIDTVIITVPWLAQRGILRVVRECERKHIRV